jgi:uncharacterized membrane protein
METKENERWAETLGELMRNADVPPTTLHSTHLPALGRQSRRRRHMSASAAVVALCAVGATTVAFGARGGPPAGPAATTREATTVTCVLTRFAEPKGTNIDVTASDDTGRYVAGRFHPEGGSPNQPTLVLWTDGVPVPFTVPGTGGFGPSATDVNSHGTVVGEGFKAGRTFAWVYRDGQLQELPTVPGYTHHWAEAVNERGDIVGFAVSEADPDQFVALIWPADQPGTVLKLAAPRSAQAVDISDDGVIIGNLLDRVRPNVTPGPARSEGGIIVRGSELPKRTGFQWDSNRIGHELPALPGKSVGEALLIRGSIVFGHLNATDEPFPVRWNLRTGKATVTDQMSVEGRQMSGNREGWFAVASMSDESLTRVSPDGAVSRLVGVDVAMQPRWISADGRNLVVTTSGSGGAHPVTLHC